MFIFGILPLGCSYKARVVAPSRRRRPSPLSLFATFGCGRNVHVSTFRGLGGWHGIVFRSHLPIHKMQG